MFARFRDSGFLLKTAYVVAWILYKIAEQPALDWVRDRISANADPLLRFFVDYFPVLTWAVAAIGLLWLTNRVARAGRQQTQTLPSNRDPRLSEIERRLGPDQRAWVDKPAHIEILVLLREVGVVMLLNRPVIPPDVHLSRLRADSEFWELKVEQALRQAGASDSQISHFKMIREFPLTLAGVNDDHVRLVNLLNEKLRRLEDLIRQIEKGSED